MRPARCLDDREPVDQRARAEREGGDAREVEALRGRPSVLGSKRRRVPRGEGDGDRGQRNVDPEHRPPVDARQQSADHRPEGGEERGASGQHAQRLPRRSAANTLLTMATAVGIISAAPQPWAARAAIIQGRSWADPGKGGRDHEDEATREEHPPQAEQVAQPPTQHHEGREREDVRREEPLALGEAPAQVRGSRPESPAARPSGRRGSCCWRASLRPTSPTSPRESAPRRSPCPP